MPTSLEVPPGSFSDILNWMLIWYAEDGVYGEKINKSDYEWLSDTPERKSFYSHFEIMILTNGDIIGRNAQIKSALPKDFDPNKEAINFVSRLAESKGLNYKFEGTGFSCVFVISKNLDIGWNYLKKVRNGEFPGKTFNTNNAPGNSSNT